MSKIKCVMEPNKIYGGVRFLREIPNPGKTSRRYCEVECVHCQGVVGRVLSNVYSCSLQSCGCKFNPSGPIASIFSGYQFKNNQGYIVEVVEYVSSKEIYVNFTDIDLIVKTNSTSVKVGSVENPYHRSFMGIGYIGEISNKSPCYSKVRRKWAGMLRRVYSNNEKLPSYSNCTVCEEWHNFSLFYEWTMKETGGNLKGLDLDKDILSVNGRIYSPDTCSFIPSVLNRNLTRLNIETGGWYDNFGGRWRTVEKCPETNKNIYVKHLDKDAANKYYVKIKAERILKLSEDFKDQISEKFYVGMKNKAKLLLSF